MKLEMTDDELRAKAKATLNANPDLTDYGIGQVPRYVLDAT